MSFFPSRQTNHIEERLRAYNQQQSHAMTKSHVAGGLKIRASNNDHVEDPFANVNPFANKPRESTKFEVDYNKNKSQYDLIDLNIQNYSRADLLHLFGFKPNIQLTEADIKDAKKILLKTHPDKSGIDPKYFIFFQQAYEKVVDIYSFQNKSTKTVVASEYKPLDDSMVSSASSSSSSSPPSSSSSSSTTSSFVSPIPQNTVRPSDEIELNAWTDKNKTLDHFFQSKEELKDAKTFNSWFNSQFEQHRFENPTEKGYGEWLKSDEGIQFSHDMRVSHNDPKAIHTAMEKKKREMLSLIPRKEETISAFSSNTSSFGSSLMEYDANFSSTALFSGSNGIQGFTDIRQAYAESIIPVSEEDFAQRQQFRSVEEYSRHRDAHSTITPLSKEDAMHQLFLQEQKANEESAALAFYYAQQADKAKQQKDRFWAGLKQLDNK